MRFLERTVDDLVTTCIEENWGDDTLLGAYVAGLKAEGPGAIDRKGVREQVMTFLMAGHETIATTLSWTWRHIALNPAVENRLFAEIDALPPGPVTPEQAASLIFTERVIKESLRLTPPVWNLTRELAAESEVGGYVLPKGTIIGLSPFVMHRDSRFFEAPLMFDPDRWLPEREAVRPRYSYFPFGAGPRSCIGANLSLLEAKLVIATVMKKFRFELVSNQEIGFKPLITLRPDPGIRVAVHRRKEESRCSGKAIQS